MIPIERDIDQWLLTGPKIDDLVLTSKAEVEKHTDDMNEKGIEYEVVWFNTAEGLCQNVTHEFFREPAQEPDWPVNRIAMMRRAGAF